MAKGDFIGEFEHFVMLAILRLGDDAYGVTIRREIESRTGRLVTSGSIYATLERLEGKGYVSSWDGDPLPERGGRTRTFYKVAVKGRKALENTERALHQMRQGLTLVPKAL